MGFGEFLTLFFHIYFSTEHKKIWVTCLHLLTGKTCVTQVWYYSHVQYLKQINLITRNFISGYEGCL